MSFGCRNLSLIVGTFCYSHWGVRSFSISFFWSNQSMDFLVEISNIQSHHKLFFFFFKYTSFHCWFAGLVPQKNHKPRLWGWSIIHIMLEIIFGNRKKIILMIIYHGESDFLDDGIKDHGPPTETFINLY